MVLMALTAFLSRLSKGFEKSQVATVFGDALGRLSGFNEPPYYRSVSWGFALG
jgi:hypothetical protein